LTKEFTEWLSLSAQTALSKGSRKNPAFKLWHINGSLESYSREQVLFTFHELNSITDVEKNILNNQAKTLVSSSYTKQVFEENGVKNVHFVPLGFDNKTFYKKNIEKKADQITFALLGKWEKRKHHAKIINAWIKRFGDNPKYVLNCAIGNPFVKNEDLTREIAESMNFKKYFNVNFIQHLESNEDYNRFLNVNDIVIGMSGGEGWGLPEFQSVCIGKHAVILNAHAYKDWAKEQNACLVNPNGLIDAYDNRFFHKGSFFNQGKIFDWEEDAFIAACEAAESRYLNDPVNHEGEKLAKDFTWEKTTDLILSHIDSLQ
jgi:hypothetical protein